MKAYIEALRKIYYRNMSVRISAGSYVKYAAVSALWAFILTYAFNRAHFVDMPTYKAIAADQFYVFDSPFMLFLLYCVFTPIVEEIVFRFIIYNSLLMWLKDALMAIIISSALFGVYHMNPVQGFYAFFMGLLICFLYYKSDNIFVPIIAHASANLVALAYTIFSYNIF
ncbi:CPBP family intramembrane glutamic endopeptidase [Butyrivibrio sp. MC2021]|uniref:CPBP family intramembrane glutamic endopeptidase n=1 Tax=Butyrivibrio sp. MC2021 TaxID=1408306 RepID=UPI000685DBF9|nr:CPBP family intramembrane glutamic endopeptidase [Butyrivibrio sp. MC2021]